MADQGIVKKTGSFTTGNDQQVNGTLKKAAGYPQPKAIQHPPAYNEKTVRQPKPERH